jgi:hypothetical protein
VFENRLLRRIFGSERDKATGVRRKPHNKQLRDLYSSSSIIRIIESWRIRWAGHVVQLAEKRLLVGKSEGR